MEMETEKNLWSSTGDPILGFPSLDAAATADAVVIGGGFTGLSAAYHLAEAGADVCLIEANRIGHGGSGRNVGLVNAGLWTPPDEVEEKLGKRQGQALNSALAAGPDLVFGLTDRHRIQCQATRNGTLHCAHSRAGLRDLENRHSQQLARGAPVRLLDAAEAAERTGSKAFYGALWDARAGTIQPLAYAQGLARAAHAFGARLFERTPALHWTYGNDLWEVETPTARIRARYLIQATNAYVEQVAEPNGFVPAHFFQLATAPLSTELLDGILPNREGCWDTAVIMSSFRLDQAGRMIVGSLGNLDGFGGACHRSWASRKLAHLFPRLRDVSFEHWWTGCIAMSSTYLPKIVVLGQNAISIYGYSGRGISPGTSFGKCAADWVLTGAWDAFPIDPSGGLNMPARSLKAFYVESGCSAKHLVSDRFK